MRRTLRRIMLASMVTIVGGSGVSATAATLLEGQSVTITFTAPKTGQYDNLPIYLTFGADNPFGTNEILSFSTYYSPYAGYNQQLNTGITPSVDTVYSGSNTLIEYGVPFGTILGSKTFSLVVTATQGSFDLTGATASFAHALTIGTTYNNVVGTFSAVTGTTTTPVPEPAAWSLMILGIGSIGYALRRGKNAKALRTA